MSGTEHAKNFAFSVFVGAGLEFLFFPASCPNPLKAPSEQTGCENFFGSTMGGIVGFVDKSAMIIGGLIIGVIIYLGAEMYEDSKKNQGSV